MASRDKVKVKKLQQTAGRNSKAVALLPPPNFSAVVDKLIYRSAFPEPCNFSFLESLQLRSVIIQSFGCLPSLDCSYLCSGRFPKENLQFLQSNNIKLFQLGIDGKDEETFAIPANAITNALKILNDEKNYPLLIHCKAGMHRTGCLVGGLRKLHKWCLAPILEEYKKFAGKRSREIDLKFLTEYDPSCLGTAAVRGSRCPCCP
ncbi:hypothetical protein OROMI_015491 [Orobanche minor]